MLTLRRIAPLFALGLLACGQPEEANLPQNEALENAPEGIVFLDEDAPLPPDFQIQAVTAAEQTALLNATNAKRTVGTKCGATTYAKAAALTVNSLLGTAANKHAEDMAKYNYFSHTGRDGSSFSVRIDRTGYKWSTAGENISAGRSDPKATIDGWYASEGHCKNFMNPAFTQIGFGKGYNASSTYKTYWVAVMARPR